MATVQLTRRQIFNIVNAAFPITDFLPDRIGTQLYFCPFHHDVNRPSAKLFFDDDGPHLYCFTCRRQYSGYHYITRVLERDPLEYLRAECSAERVAHLIAHPPVPQPQAKPRDISSEVAHYRSTQDLDRFLNDIYGTVPIT